jgi:hypothetical protein
MYYTCEVAGNDSKNYNGGIWKRKETESTIVFTFILREVLNTNPYHRNDKFTFWKKPNRNGKYRSSHGMKDWGDGTYTIYPNFEGTPYYMKPIVDKDMLKVCSSVIIKLPTK